MCVYVCMCACVLLTVCACICAMCAMCVCVSVYACMYVCMYVHLYIYWFTTTAVLRLDTGIWYIAIAGGYTVYVQTYIWVRTWHVTRRCICPDVPVLALVTTGYQLCIDHTYSCIFGASVCVYVCELVWFVICMRKHAKSNFIINMHAVYILSTAKIHFRHLCTCQLPLDKALWSLDILSPHAKVGILVGIWKIISSTPAIARRQ